MFLKEIKTSEKNADMVFYIYLHTYHFQYSSVLFVDLSYHWVSFSFGQKLLSIFLQGRSASSEFSQFLFIWGCLISALFMKDSFAGHKKFLVQFFFPFEYHSIAIWPLLFLTSHCHIVVFLDMMSHFATFKIFSFSSQIMMYLDVVLLLGVLGVVC